MGRVRVDKGKHVDIETEPAKKGRKGKQLSVNKNGKISKSTGVRSRKGKVKTDASRAKDRALAIK